MLSKHNDIKNQFNNKIHELIKNDTEIRYLFYEILIEDTAYIVGGFLRDILNNKISRDVDVIVGVTHKKLLEILEYLKVQYNINRHNGIKIFFKHITVDIWSIENNWAFKNELVKLNEDDKLLSIAKGCFYNYDALVINLNNSSFNIKYYNEFKKNNQLDILQSSPKYKNLNPTTEANILRAIFIRHNFQAKFSDNALLYLIKKIGFLTDKYDKPIERLLNFRDNYKKYNELSEEMIKFYVNEIRTTPLSNNQQLLNI